MNPSSFDSALDQARDLGERGIQIAAYAGDRLAIDEWAGVADGSGKPVEADTLFPVFSVTKAATAIAIHVQAERGLLDYDAPVAEYWPEFAARGKTGITITHVLAHQSGIPQMPAQVTPKLMCDWDWMIGQIEDFEPWFEPGTQNAYQASIFGWILGEIVRRTDPGRRPFGEFLRDDVFLPLGVSDFWVGVPDGVVPRVAELTSDVSEEAIENESEISKAAKPTSVAFGVPLHNRREIWQACLPGTGGIASARSVARLFAMLANGGELDGVRLLSEDRVRRCLIPRPHGDRLDLSLLGGDRATASLGLGGLWLAGTPFGTGPGVLCHTGFGGSLAFADLDSGVAIAITHNRLADGLGMPGHAFAPVVEAVRRELRDQGVPLTAR